MADIFLQEDAQKLLAKKSILFLGDSNVRAIYKDVLWLLHDNTLIPHAKLRRKGEPTYEGDTLVAGGNLHRGRDYVEVRQYRSKSNADASLEFHFLTRCYGEEVKALLEAIRKGEKSAPNVLVVNSCVWDISRWGPRGVEKYKDNMVALMKHMQKALPKECLVVWPTTLPVAQKIKGAFLIKQVEFLKHCLHFDVMEANFLARDLVVNHGFDILDLHYHLRLHVHRQTHDGVHWLPHAIRHITNLLLTHLALAWNHPLPGNLKTPALENLVDFCNSQDDFLTVRDEDLAFPEHVPNDPPPPPVQHNKRPLKELRGASGTSSKRTEYFSRHLFQPYPKKRGVKDRLGPPNPPRTHSSSPIRKSKSSNSKNQRSERDCSKEGRKRKDSHVHNDSSRHAWKHHSSSFNPYPYQELSSSTVMHQWNLIHQTPCLQPEERFNRYGEPLAWNPPNMAHALHFQNLAGYFERRSFLGYQTAGGYQQINAPYEGRVGQRKMRYNRPGKMR